MCTHADQIRFVYPAQARGRWVGYHYVNYNTISDMARRTRTYMAGVVVENEGHSSKGDCTRRMEGTTEPKT